MLEHPGNPLRAQIHSLIGDAENALSYLREAWKAEGIEEAGLALKEAGERFEEAVVAPISRLVYPGGLDEQA